MTKEEIKNHFKDAKIIKCLMDNVHYHCDKNKNERVTDVHFDGSNYWIDCTPNKKGKALNSILVYSPLKDKLAEIIK